MVSGAQSLKDKRAVVRSVKDKLQARWNMSVAEVGDQDLWQSAELGFAVVGSDRPFVESLLDKMMDLIEAEAKVTSDERDFVEYGDDFFGNGEVSHWEPDQPGPPITRAPPPGKRPGLQVSQRLKSRRR